MDPFKLAIGFMAEVLYIKKVICYEEFNAILDVQNHKDLDPIIQNMLDDKYNVYKRGEAYAGTGR